MTPPRVDPTQLGQQLGKMIRDAKKAGYEKARGEGDQEQARQIFAIMSAMQQMLALMVRQQQVQSARIDEMTNAISAMLEAAYAPRNLVFDDEGNPTGVEISRPQMN